MQAALGAISLVASIVNGAIGYGFSSITVPLALLFLSNRVLNPALVLVELGLNAYVLWVNRRAVPAVLRRVAPIAAGLTPGVVAGTLIVSRVDAGWLKLGTFTLLLPLILLQAAGFRRPVRAERAAGVVAGGGVGLLYAVTTVSGPPLAAMLNNQGLANAEFRAAMAVLRLAEGTITAIAYAFAALYTRESLLLIPAILPGVLIGVPIGAWLVRQVNAEVFRRVCMNVDAVIVAAAIAVLLPALGIASVAVGAALLLVVAGLSFALLYRTFSSARPAALTPGDIR
jgi:uncharacterized membrane protein YfcA